MESQLAKFNEDRKNTESEIAATPDVTIRRTYENRLNLLFEQIEQKEQEIKDLQAKLQGRSIDHLIKILQPSGSPLPIDGMRAAYLNVLRHRGWKNQHNPAMLDEIITQLFKIPKGQFDYAPLEEFIAHLIINLQDVGLIAELQHWGEEQLGQGWTDLLEQVEQQQSQHGQQAQSALLIAISRGDEASTQSQAETYYQIKAWLIHDTQDYQTHRQGISPIIVAGMTGDETYAQEALPDELPKLISQFLVESSHLFDSDPELHICLPVELMNHAIDLWKLDDDGPVKPMLGRRYKVVLRCTERWSRSYRQEKIWKQKWDRQKSFLENFACDAFIAGDDNNLEDLYYDLLEETVVGLKVKQAPTCVGTNSLFGVLLQTGTPIAIWGRTNLKSTTNDTELTRILNACCLKNLLHTVQEERQRARKVSPEAHIGHHLSLLWDDPYLVPPKSA
ncbi:MAG: hypothetical protein KME45_24855 [Stenomitos rutilans HA7619-LM2]|nr:hypothetical protein [Stenomitos rutilans HA7619-LM2]